MRLRQFADGDWPEFVAFAARYFGESHSVDRAFNEHWFHTSGYDGWAACVLESTRGAIVGLMMVIVVRAKFGDTVVPLGWISSGAVDERARETGAGAQMYLWVYSQFPLVGAMCGNELSEPINDALGLNIPGVGLRRFVFVHDRRTAELCQPADRDLVLGTSFPDGGTGTRGLAVRRSDGVPQDYDRLWERFRAGFVCTTERDAQYMEHRYIQAPHVDYQLLEMRANDELRALAVLRFEPTPAGNACRVVDFVADSEWASDGWSAVAQASRGAGMLFTDFMVIGSAQDIHLGRAGFLPADGDTGLNAIPHLLSPVEHRAWSNSFHLGGSLAKSDQSWRRADAIYFTKGDGDRDWPTQYYIAGRRGSS